MNIFSRKIVHEKTQVSQNCSVRELLFSQSQITKFLPLGTDLVLHENPEADKIVVDGKKLGEVIIATALRFGTPLAFPLMDLSIEKEAILKALFGPDFPAHKIDNFHFSSLVASEEIAAALNRLDQSFLNIPRYKASLEAMAAVIESKLGFLPIGMCLGPFSLATKLLSDPITPVALSGMGMKEDPSVQLWQQVITLSELVVRASIKKQLKNGAKAIFVCEPAANKVYLSPNMLSETEPDIFDNFVILPLKRIKNLLDKYDVELFLHNCGDLDPLMLKKIASLDPALLSLGSPVKLPEATRYIPKTTILFGNLPTKYFSQEFSEEKLRLLISSTISEMRQTGHPFILGSECEVKAVPSDKNSQNYVEENIASALTIARALAE